MARKADQPTKFTTPWRSATVSELQAEGILLVEDGNHGEYRPRSEEFVTHGTAFIRAADIDAGNVLFESASKINDVAVARITKGIGSGGDVLLTHKGTVGKVAFAREHAPPFVCSPQTTFWRTLNQSVLSRRYLYAYLRSPDFHRQLSARAGETDMAPYVSLTAQRTLTVVLPPTREQIGIATILGALDDKIDVNRQMNETLEEVARALFKSWFVDFDPVRAKAAGKRPYGIDATMSALFPESFEETPSGIQPRGWGSATLAALCRIKHGYAFRGSFFTSQETKHLLVTPGNFAIGGGFHEARKKFYDGPVPSDFVLQPGALLVTMTDLSKGGDTLGYPAFVPLDLPYRLLHNQRIGLVEPIGEAPLSKHVIHWILRQPRYRQHVLGTASGSTVRHTSPSRILAYPIVLSPASVLAAAEVALAPLQLQVDRNLAANRVLSALRDTLLPKLLSGELRLKDAEKLAGEAP